LAIFLSTHTFAIENQMLLKAGPSFASAHLEAREGSKDDFGGWGFNTHFGKKWVKWETTFSSYVYWGKIESPLRFRAQEQDITGSGSYTHVSFGPIIKYHLNNYQIFEHWQFYLGAGPVWSHQAIKLDRFTTTGSFNQNQKLTFSSFGGAFVFGIEENLPSKEMHPVYIELLYSYKKSDEASVVDLSKVTETNVLSSEERKQDIQGHFIMVSFGLLIF
jgi:hypothetical protein